VVDEACCNDGDAVVLQSFDGDDAFLARKRAGRRQERLPRRRRRTVQAPQNPSPQPYFRAGEGSRSPRNTQSRLRSSLVSTATGFPLSGMDALSQGRPPHISTVFT